MTVSLPADGAPDAELDDLGEAQLVAVLPELGVALLRRVAECPRARPHLAAVLKDRLAPPPLSATAGDQRLERLSLLPLARVQDALGRAAAAWHGATIRRAIDGVALARLVQRLGPTAHRFALRHPELHHAPEETVDPTRLGSLVEGTVDGFRALLLNALPPVFARHLAFRLSVPMPAPGTWRDGVRDHALRCLSVAAAEVLNEGA